MSPVAFKQQVTHLVAELARCIQFCEGIRVNRNIGSTHENLDKLQSTLEVAEASIPTSYNSIREYVGPELDVGDERARSEMDRHVHEIQTKIKPRLRNIAHPQSSSEKKDRNPGFRELRQQWRTINDGVTQTMLSLSRRIELASSSDSTQTPVPKPKKTGDVDISSRELDQLISHLKISWEEVISEGKLVYVNMYDPGRKQYERPNNAFVKTLPGSRLRAPSWDRRSPRTVEGGW